MRNKMSKELRINPETYKLAEECAAKLGVPTEEFLENACERLLEKLKREAGENEQRKHRSNH